MALNLNGAVRPSPISFYARLTTCLSASLLTVGTMSMLLGCGSDATNAVAPSAGQAYWTLRLNYHALNLSVAAPYNSVQLTATPITASGTPLSGAGSVTFSTGDSTVSVSANGLVTANYTTADAQHPTFVAVQLQYQGVTLADTAFIQVTDTIPAQRFMAIAVRPAVGSSTVCHLNAFGASFAESCGPLVVDGISAPADTLQDVAQNVLIAFESSNTATASVNSSGVISENDTGHVTFSASTWAYGVVLRDSLRYFVSWPALRIVNVQQITPAGSLTPVLIFDRPPVSLSAGGTIVWINSFEQPIDVVFDDSTQVQPGCLQVQGICIIPLSGGGNIPPFYLDPTGADTSVHARGGVGRSFPMPGTYHYHSRLFPMSTGVILVQSDPSS